ncbi:Short-chain type dehydrogenase/reductase [Cytospora mali]|uniref:Short-chain type dehydrogenase/reductase n=1 Tax=Cytospora mali TaxID=578113 RepID=A0A194UMU4_CYTMA|nr:Short-chain type dehydrogenase/reductase [Valsa mali var. pyri (nom. inval.)]
MDPLPINPTKHDVYDFISPTTGTEDAAVGKTVLVTGAGSGIGRHTAIYFARAGATSVVLAGRNAKALEESKVVILAEAPKCDVLCIPTDITDPSAVANLFQKAGKIDILINNAGSTGIRGPLAATDFQKWWMAFEINVRGTYMVTCEFLRLLQGGPGVVLNVSSRSSYVTASDMSAYQASKSALNRLTEFIDKEHASQGVVAIAFHPGGISNTKLAEDAPEWLRPDLIDTRESRSSSRPHQKETQLNRSNPAALPAATALYLTLPRAKYLSGRFVNARWDMEELETHRERIISEDLLKLRVLGIDDHL